MSVSILPISTNGHAFDLANIHTIQAVQHCVQVLYKGSEDRIGTKYECWGFYCLRNGEGGRTLRRPSSMNANHAPDCPPPFDTGLLFEYATEAEAQAERAILLKDWCDVTHFRNSTRTQVRK